MHKIKNKLIALLKNTTSAGGTLRAANFARAAMNEKIKTASAIKTRPDRYHAMGPLLSPRAPNATRRLDPGLEDWLYWVTCILVPVRKNI